jgi:hypothetical protein
MQHEKTEAEWLSDATSLSPIDRASAAEHWANLPTTHAKRLSGDSDIRVRIAVASRSFVLAPAIIDKLANSITPDVRAALASSVQPLTEAQFNKLIRDLYRAVPENLTMSDRIITDKQCLQLLNHPQNSVRIFFIVSGAKMPITEQLKVARDGSLVDKLNMLIGHSKKMNLDDDAVLLISLDGEPALKHAGAVFLDAGMLTKASQHENEDIRYAASSFLIQASMR